MVISDLQGSGGVCWRMIDVHCGQFTASDQVTMLINHVFNSLSFEADAAEDAYVCLDNHEAHCSPQSVGHTARSVSATIGLSLGICALPLLTATRERSLPSASSRMTQI